METVKKVFEYADISEARFWSLVAMANWPHLDYHSAKINYLKSLNKTTGHEFRHILEMVWHVLDSFIDDRNPAQGGDDSHNDLVYHIIGLGKDEFYACLENYNRIEARGKAPYGSKEGYQESFGYAVPYKGDWDNVEEAIDGLEERIKRKETIAVEDESVMTFDSLIENISASLGEGNGAWVAKMYNEICGGQLPIEHCGNDTWKEKVEA